LEGDKGGRRRGNRYTDVELARWIEARLEDGAATGAPYADVEQARWIAATLTDGQSDRSGNGVALIGPVAPQDQDKGGRPIKYDRDGFLENLTLVIMEKGRRPRGKKELVEWGRDILMVKGVLPDEKVVRKYLNEHFPKVYEACRRPKKQRRR
jgi:hypothetical protein